MTEKIDNNFDKINNRSCNNNEQIDNKSCIIDTKNDKHIDNLNIESCTLHTKGDINTEQISNKSCIVKNDDEITTSSVIERMFRSTTSGSTESSSNKFIEHKLKTVRLRLKKLEDDLYIVLSTNKSSKIKSGYRTFIIAVGEDSVNSGSSTIIGFAKDFFTAPEEFFVIHSPRKISDRELFVEIIESSGFVLKSQIQSGVEPEMVSHVDDCAGIIDVQSGVELKAQTGVECVTDVTTDMTIEIDIKVESERQLGIGTDIKSRVESERQFGITTDTAVATTNEIVKIVKTKSGVVNSVEVENIMQTGIANIASLKSEFDIEIESDLNIKSGIEIKADIATDITSKIDVETELKVEHTKIILFRDVKFLKSCGSSNHNSYTKSNYKYCKLNNIIFETIMNGNKVYFDNDSCFNGLKDMDCLARRHWMGW